LGYKALELAISVFQLQHSAQDAVFVGLAAQDSVVHLMNGASLICSTFLAVFHPMASAFEVGLVLCLLFIAYHVFNLKKQSSPPGPKGYPIVGNLFDMPAGNEVFVWAEWREKWGS
jgi:hypothetical protein